MTHVPIPPPDAATLVRFESIRAILRRKGAAVFSIDPDATVFDAIRQMEEHAVGALVILEHGAIVGVISERDYARKVALKGRSSKETTVREIMSAPVVTVPLTASVMDAMKLVTERRVRHLPVMEDGAMVGLVSIGDLVNSTITSLADTVRDLNAYIAGDYPG